MHGTSYRRQGSRIERLILRRIGLSGRARSPLPLAGMLLLAWGAASPARAGTMVISTPVTGPITVNSGDTVEIDAGGAVTSTTTAVIVKAGGTLLIAGGSVTSSSSGPSVFLDGGDVTVTSGSVSGDIGVLFNSGGTLTVSGGSVTGNNGVIVNGGGTANISGGSVAGQNADVLVNGGLVNVTGGSLPAANGSANFGVEAEGGVVNISGGSVAGNFNAVRIDTGGTVNISGGSLSNPSNLGGAAVFVEGTATISGGSLSGQVGVDVFSGTATISHGTISGGNLGIKVSGGSASISGGSISGVIGLQVTSGAATISGCNLLRAGSTLLGTLQDGAAVNMSVGVSAPGQLTLDSATMQITCPANQTALATSGAGAVVTFPNPGVSNTCGSPVKVAYVPASGSTFPVGVTPVTCTVTDTFGNRSSSGFTVTVLPASDLAVFMSAASDKSNGNAVKVNSKQSLTYTIMLLNGGPNSADEVTLQDALPDGFVFESATSTGGTLQAPPAGATGTLTAKLGTLGANASATVRITGHFSDRKTSIPNTATVSTSATDPNPANNQATVNVTVN